jgi:hypothetical protein
MASQPCSFAFICPSALLTLRPPFSSLLPVRSKWVTSQTEHKRERLMDETPTPSSAKTERITRREFARRAAIASAVASVAPASAVATPASAVPTSAPSAPPQQSADMSKLSPEGRAEVEARIQTILNQYGSRFSDTQKADLRRLCAMAQPPLDRLRAYTLENGDGSALYLKPLVEREKDPLANTRVGKTPAASQNP